MLKPVKLALSFAILALLANQTLAFPNMSGQPGATQAAPGQAAPGQAAPGQAAPVQAAPLKGTVTETMKAGGYTYVCLEDGGKKQWVAMPPTEVKVGEQVEVAPGMVMQNFTSKTLGRTFETITFSQGLVKK
jgi:hypothetical protein